MLYIKSSLHIIFYCILVDPGNSKQHKDPRRELGISLFSYLSFLKFWKEDRVILIIFLFEYFLYENKREEIIWLLQNKINIGGKILKSIFSSFWSFFGDFICIRKICIFSKLHFRPRKCSLCSKYSIRWRKFVLAFLEFYFIF